ncbi:MAG: serine/threonine-protein kinase, partial [Myxococcales bacterium]|nr:serine/threonine-protein kinase [Myxococcales bacterium]
GMTLGRYRLRERIGEGGMGVVFAAYDPELDRTVAVKVLHPGLGGPGSRGEERLRREGQTMARMAHANVIRVYDVGVQGDIVFVAMEHIAGGTLKSWLADAPRSADEILATFAQAARGLAAAHDANLVHRDFKPSNVLVSNDGRVLVTDFGVARASIDPPSRDGAAALVDPLGATMTRAGSLVGTPAYMAPEQLQGRPVDGRADQFSFCVALWRALYGKAPYAGESWSELASSTLAGKLVEPPASARVAGHVRAALERGLHPDPARRFASVGALLQALDPDRRHRRRVRAALALGALAAVVAVAVGVERMRADPCAVDVDRFAGVWDAAARAAMHSAFAATGAPYAEASFSETIAAGQYQHAEPDADRLVERARGSAYAPVLASALTVAGDVQEKLSHIPAAEKRFQEALLAADAGGDDSVRFDDEVHLANVVGYRLERDADGQEHARRAQALLQRLGADQQREARLTRTVALAAWWNGRYEDARHQVERAVALQEAIDPHGADLARALHLYGIVLQDMKLDEASLAPLERARTIGEAALGAEHPVVAQIQQTMGGSLRRLGRYDAAAKEYLASLTKIEHAQGTDAFEYALALQNLGTLYLDEGKFDDAIASLRRSSDRLAKSLGAEHSRVADALEILGSAYSKAGRAAEAEAT